MIKNSKFKSFPKILIIFFLATFIVQLFCLIFLIALPQVVQAVAPGNFAPQVPIPGYNFIQSKTDTTNIAELIRAIYNYGIGIIGILAAVVLMVGGVLWIVAGGNTTQIGEAKAWIGAALTGLVLALTSYLILSTVNPALVNLQITNIQSVTEAIIGSCQPVESACIDNSTKDDCDKLTGTFIQGGKCPTSCCAWESVALLGTAYKSCNYNIKLSEKDCQAQAGNAAYSYLNNAQCNQISSITGLGSGYVCGKVTVTMVTGSCATPTVCIDRLSKEECDDKKGTFLKDGKCPTSCCSYISGGFGAAKTLCEEGQSETYCHGQSQFLKYFSRGKCQNNDCVSTGGASGSW